MEGGCFCGRIRYRIEGPVRRTTNCHCLHCRRTSGAPFLTWVEVRKEQLRFTAGAPTACESRPGVTRRFCSACGTQLTYQNAETADEVDVTACSLDVVDAIAPEDHVWADRMVPWLRLADGLPRYRLGRYDD